MQRRDLLSLAALAPLAQAQAQAQTQAPKTNFIILFADDLGYGDLGCYGNPVIRTPHLDRMAGEGTRFTSFYAAAPVCTPSRAGLLTGRYPIRAGQPNNTGPETVGGLPVREVLLPQLLKPLGYRTMAIGKWHLGHQPVEQLPTRRGFDHFFGLPYSNDMIPPWVKTQVPMHLYRDTQPIEENPSQDNLTERYTVEAVKFIEASRDPFFLYLPYAMPHLPVSASRFRGKSRNGLYGDAVETLDWSVGEILATLAKNQIDRNTMVVFCSDNGPWHNLPDRMLAGGVERWHTGTKGPLRGAKGTSYEGGPRVPGIFRWPGMVQANMVQMDMASTLDLLPTIVSAAGGTLPQDRKYDGYNLLPLLRGEAQAPRPEFFYCLGNKLEAVREGPWKYREAKPTEPELFHLEWDPAEAYNLATREPSTASRLQAKLLAMRQELSSANGTPR
ncbi:MAG: sulfatase [Bryobacter sp.]|nr:sulfatase [Bryobacter sp.]